MSDSVSMQKPAQRRFIEFLGSMELAITLLSALAIASVIGTVLQQNQSYNDYIIKFGPFWFEIFEKMALYDVYSAIWFLSILAFLILSTSVCVYRHAPIFLREMKHFRTRVQLKSLQSFHHKKEWQVAVSADELSQHGNAFFQHYGYQAKVRQDDEHTVIAAKKGSANRLGYILTHVGVIIICIGALFDSRLPLMVSEWQGNLKPETRNISASEVPEISRISPSNASFRGTVQIPEGGSANIVFLNIRDGYVVQELPFAIELKDFRVEHYSTGAPKSFESDLIIHDDKLDKPLEATIAVNHPLIYRGYALYQASFADGGTKLDLKLWSLSDKPGESLNTKTAIFNEFAISGAGERYTVEMNDFRLFNINPVKNADGKVEQKNMGPSIVFKIRDASGVAREYTNYMLPVTTDGITTIASGMREDPSQPFRYLHIPIDDQGGIDLFMKLLAAMADEQRVAKSARDAVTNTMGQVALKNDKLREDIIRSMTSLVGLFGQGGYEAVVNDVQQKVPEDKQQAVVETYLKILQAVMSNIYQSVLKEKGIDQATEENWKFFDIAMESINTLPYYGSPVFIQMNSFEHIQAAGVQITRSPGKDIVYFGCVLLMVGVFFLFYINPIRYWLWIDQQQGKTRVLLAGVSHRKTLDFDKQFDELAQKLDRQLSNQNKPE